jgi:N-methylhydantoinase B/oxoprolinase/acetone carboxylase alpha subunit
VTFDALANDIISIRSPGGGGWGSPNGKKEGIEERDPSLEEEDPETKAEA